MRILVVSDEVAVSDKLCDLLIGTHGCVVPGRGKIRQAAELATRYPADALFTVLPTNFDDFVELIGEVRDASSARIVAIGPADDAQAILRVQREGGFHFIDQSNLTADLSTALRRLRTEPPPSTRRGRVISTVSSGGGSGSSTLAVNLATAFTVPSKPTALLDLNLATGDLASLLQLEPRNSISDFCQNLGRMDHSMFHKCFGEHSSGVRLLSRPSRFADIQHVSSRGIRKAIAMSRLNFPYVIIDIGSAYNPHGAIALHQSDVIVLVMRLDFSSLQQAHRALDHFEEIGVNRSKVRLVINRFRRIADLKQNVIEQSLGVKVFQVIPDDPKSVTRANNRGIPIVVDRPKSKVSRIMRSIAKNVNGAT